MRRNARTPSTRLLVSVALAAILLPGLTGGHLIECARGAVYVTEDMLWPGGIVPVQYEDGFDPFSRIRVEIAFDIWEQVANVQFVPWDGEAEDYVLVRNPPGGGGSNSRIGRVGEQQILNIRAELTNITDYGLAHEVGHTLGYYHTHQRPDWDDYVDRFDARIDTCRFGNFSAEPTALAYPRNAMDYTSVMSYGECIFATCGRVENMSCACEDDTCNRYSFPGCSSNCCDMDSITCCSEDPLNCRVLLIEDFGDRFLYQFEMGQREYITEIDAKVMSWLYPQPGTFFLEANYSPTDETGTFHHPFLTVQSVLDNAPDNIRLIVQPGTYQQPVDIITKPMIIEAGHGAFVIR